MKGQHETQRGRIQEPTFLYFSRPAILSQIFQTSESVTIQYIQILIFGKSLHAFKRMDNTQRSKADNKKHRELFHPEMTVNIQAQFSPILFV